MELKYSYSNQLPSTAEIKKLESDIALSGSISLIDLMEQAGTQVAAFILDRFAALKETKKEICILSGPGNNGGDGLVVARLLLAAGYNAKVILVSSSKYSAELQNQIERFRTENLPLNILVEHETTQTGFISFSGLKASLNNAELIVDCLLGSGQKGEPREIIKSVCEALNSELSANPEKQLLSVDVPTGVNADSGEVCSCHLQPNITVCLQYIKRGMLQFPAFESLGEFAIVDAGIIDEQNQNFSRYSILSNDSKLLQLKRRKKSAHKGDFGHILVIGGSPEMPGAPQLAATSALRSGAGLVTQLCFNNIFLQSTQS